MKKSFLLLASTVLLFGCKHDLTGTYSGFGNDGSLFSVVIVDSNGKLQGRYQHLWIDQEKIKEDDGLIDASEDNGQIIGTLKPASFLSQTIPLSGSSDGTKLSLSGQASMSSITLELPKTSKQELKNQKQELNNRIKNIELNNYINKIKKITEEESNFLNYTQNVVAKIASVEKFWADTTHLMSDQTQQQLSIKNPDDRLPLASKMQKENFASEKERRDMDNFKEALSNSKIQREAIDLAQGCHQAHTETESNPVPPELKTWNTVCLSMYPVFNQYMKRIDEINNSINSAQTVWDSEHPKQLQMSQDAFNLYR